MPENYKFSESEECFKIDWYLPPTLSTNIERHVCLSHSVRCYMLGVQSVKTSSLYPCHVHAVEVSYSALIMVDVLIWWIRLTRRKTSEMLAAEADWSLTSMRCGAAGVLPVVADHSRRRRRRCWRLPRLPISLDPRLRERDLRAWYLACLALSSQTTAVRSSAAASRRTVTTRATAGWRLTDDCRARPGWTDRTTDRQAVFSSWDPSHPAYWITARQPCCCCCSKASYHAYTASWKTDRTRTAA